jgi:hypothetical protein
MPPHRRWSSRCLRDRFGSTVSVTVRRWVEPQQIPGGVARPWSGVEVVRSVQRRAPAFTLCGLGSSHASRRARLRRATGGTGSSKGDATRAVRVELEGSYRLPQRRGTGYVRLSRTRSAGRPDFGTAGVPAVASDRVHARVACTLGLCGPRLAGSPWRFPRVSRWACAVPRASVGDLQLVAKLLEYEQREEDDQPCSTAHRAGCWLVTCELDGASRCVSGAQFFSGRP